MLWCFVSAMHRNTQDSSPIMKQLRTCGTVRQIWVRLHNLSCSAPEAYPWETVEQTSCRSPSFQYLHVNMMDSLLVKVQLILQQKWSHTWVSGHQFKNFCNCFCTGSNWQLTTTWLPSRSLCPSLNLLTIWRNTHETASFPQKLKWFQPFPELRQLFPEVQNRTLSFACCENGGKHNLPAGLIWMQWLG